MGLCSVPVKSLAIDVGGFKRRAIAPGDFSYTSLFCHLSGGLLPGAITHIPFSDRVYGCF